LTLMIHFYERMGKFEEGIECGKQALKIAEEEFGPDDISLTPILVAIGRINMAEKKFDESKQLYKRALKIAEEKVGKDHPKTAEIVYELGAFFFVKPEELSRNVNTKNIEKYKQKGYWINQDLSKVTLINRKQPGQEKEENKKGWSLDRAEKLFLHALKIIENTLGKDHPDYARILNRLGSLYIERVQYTKAEEYLTEALNISIKKLGPLHSRVAQTYKHLFTLYNLQEKKIEESRNCSRKALEVLKHIHGEDSIEVSNIYTRMGDQCNYANLKDEAKEYFLKAKAIRVAKLGPEHKDTIAIENLLNSLRAPPPPPPPPCLRLDVEELIQQANVDITDEMKAQRGRNELLDAIKNYGKGMKKQLASAESATKKEKKAANLEEKKRMVETELPCGF